MSNKEIRKYFGKKFYKQKDGYWANMMPIHAHRWVWINHHGAIPKGMDIHHKDGNKDNNEIENLEMLNRSDHLKKHWKEGSYDLDKRKKQLNEVRPIEWLKSEEGRKSVSEKGKQIWKNRKNHVIKCEHCGIEKEFKRWARFCTKNCYMKWRYIHKKDFIESNCCVCDKIFMRYKSKPHQTCSVECGMLKKNMNKS